MTLVEKARALRPLIEKAAESLSNEDAIDAVDLFPAWKSGIDYKVGTRVKHEGKLYSVQTEHTSQLDWQPNVANTLFIAVCADHEAGTLDNPIPYDGNMILVSGKYYIQDGVVYLCNRDTGIAVFHPLASLVGLYVDAV